MTDAEIVQTAQYFREEVLLGTHAPASYRICMPLLNYLCRLLVFCDLRECTFENVRHYYLVLKDGRVLDPSIDQFAETLNREPTQAVYLGPPLVCHNAA